MIINLISNPRNLSTALMYSFAQRADTVVVDEPHYGIYLRRTGLQHPGYAELLDVLPTDEAAVHRQVTELYAKHAVVFLKNMAHHMRELKDQHWMRHAFHILYIRSPEKIVASFARVMEAPSMLDIGMADQYQWWQYLKASELPYAVLDSDDLVQQPEAVLKALCAKIGIAFDVDMLHWPAGPKPYDGPWAPYWYANVHRSSGFAPQPAPAMQLSEPLAALAEQCKPFYEALSAEKLVPFTA